MRILYHHRTLGDGAEGIHIREMVDAFRRLGHHVDVSAVAGTQDYSAERPPHSFLNRVRRSLPDVAYEAAQLAHSAASIGGLVRAIRRFRPDFVYKRHARYDFGPVLAARRQGVPVALEVNCVYSAPSLRRFERVSAPPLLRAVERWTFSSATQNIAVSSALAAELLETAPAASAIVMSNGVNLARFDPRIDSQVTRSRLGIGSQVVVGFVGALWRWHGLDLLIEAFARVRLTNTHLLIVGDGEMRNELESIVRRRGLSSRVSFTGRVPHGDVPALIAAMHIAALPADHRRHASPMKLIEYMAMSRAVVAPRIANVLEILVDGRDSLIFEPDDAGSLASCLDRLAENATLREQLGSAARSKVEQSFTWDNNARRVIDWYESLND